MDWIGDLGRESPEYQQRRFPWLNPIACTISASLATYCVRLELRPLPSTGVTRLQRYYEPLRHLRAPGLSVTGVRLVVPDHALRLPVLPALSLCTCCRHYPGAATGGITSLFHPVISAFPGMAAGSARASSFSRLVCFSQCSRLLCEPMVFSAAFGNSEEAGVEGPFEASALPRGTDRVRTPPPTPPSVDEESSGMRPPI